MGGPWTFRRAQNLAIAGLFACLSLAQTPPPQASVPNPSPRLEVTVSDENGVAVPSALVLLIHSQQPNPQQSETDFAGHCSFTRLLPEKYELRVEKPGFYRAILPALDLSTTSSVEVILSHQQEIRETVNVEESVPVINPAQVAAKEQLTGIDIIDLPYAATMTIAMFSTLSRESFRIHRGSRT
jgi:Carboxypeptidase regulatory-like domain